MIFYIIKVLLSLVTLLAISEISKRSTTMGSILASIPLVSLLAFVWIYIDTAKIAELSQGIFWLVMPSLIFFIPFPVLLKKNVDFWLSMGISLTIMVIGYFVMLFILKKFGINI
ncbi:MAG: DUF3147 family protein [Paludibacter sp.]|nr:DUF3147 family protein [Paludibacter sp.]